jgi:hypothetical protein
MISSIEGCSKRDIAREHLKEMIFDDTDPELNCSETTVCVEF